MKRRSFTLIELMIALLILGMISSVIAFPLFSPLKYHFFNKNVDRIKRELLLTKQIAKMCSIDIKVHFTIENRHLTMTRETEGEIKAFRFHFKQPLVFNHIQECSYNGMNVPHLIVEIDHHGCCKGGTFTLIMKEKGKDISSNLLL